MKRYTIIHPLLMSFFSADLYRDIAKNWKGIGIPYLFLILSLYCIPGVLRMHAEFSEYVNSHAASVISQMPTITIKKGELSIDKPSPYMIHDQKTGKPVIVIDTTGSSASIKESGASILLTKSKAFIRLDESNTRTIDLSDIGDLTLDRKAAYDLVDNAGDVFPLVLYPLALLFSFVYYLVLALVYSSIGSLYRRMARISLNFSSILRISVVSLTPTLVVATLFSVTGISVPLWWVINFVVSLFYLFFGIRATTATN